MDAPVEGKYPFGDLGGSALGTAGKGETTTQIVTAGFTYTLSPTFIFDGVFGNTRHDQHVGIPNETSTSVSTSGRSPAPTAASSSPTTPVTAARPNITGFGFSDIGFIDTWTPVWRHERSYTYASNFTKVHGAHEIRLGRNIRRLELNHWQPETANPRGLITFASGVDQHLRRRPRARRIRYAAALLGLVNSLRQVAPVLRNEDARIAVRAVYVRDRWQVSRKLRSTSACATNSIR